MFWKHMVALVHPSIPKENRGEVQQFQDLWSAAESALEGRNKMHDSNHQKRHFTGEELQVKFSGGFC
jgi:hypothetical protein